MEHEELMLVVTQAYDSAKSAHKRLDTLEMEVKDIHELTASMKVMNEKVDTLTDNMSEIKSEVRKFSQRPAQWWDKLAAAAIGAASSGVIAAILSQILQ